MNNGTCPKCGSPQAESMDGRVIYTCAYGGTCRLRQLERENAADHLAGVIALQERIVELERENAELRAALKQKGCAEMRVCGKCNCSYAALTYSSKNLCPQCGKNNVAALNAELKACNAELKARIAELEARIADDDDEPADIDFMETLRFWRGNPGKYFPCTPPPAPTQEKEKA